MSENGENNPNPTAASSPRRTRVFVKDATKILLHDARTGTYTTPLPEENMTTKPSPFPSGKENPPAEKKSFPHFVFHPGRFFRFGLRDVDSVIEEQDRRLHASIDMSVISEDHLALLGDSYDVGRTFAEGGQGILYSGLDKKLRRIVAIKTLRPELSGDASQRRSFLKEAKITAQLDHPSVIPIYSLNSDPLHNLHLAMKYVKGRTFKQYLDQVSSHYRLDGIRSFDERKSLFFRLEVFLRVCDAMEYAHSRNIMHCDLKPENIMIGEYREVYIMDWGIARLIQDPEFDPVKWVRPQKIVGTPRFLSPEAVSGEYCDERADIFAMGLILFEAVTLQEAFPGENSEEVILRIRDGQISPILHRFHAHIDRDLAAIIRKATEHNRKNRYASVSDLSADLRKYLRGDEISARPDNFLSALRRRCVKHPRTLIFLTLGMLLAGAVFNSYSLVRELHSIHFRAVRDFAVGTVYARCAATGQRLERLCSKQEQTLESIAADLMFLFDSTAPDTRTRKFCSLSELVDPETAPLSGIYSPVYHHKVDFEHLAWKTPSGFLAPEEDRTMRKLSILTPRFLQAVLSSSSDGAFSPSETGLRTREAIEKGLPLHTIGFAFSNGLFAVYPASASYLESFDPRSRVWYSDALETPGGKPVWTPPFRSINKNAGYLFACSVPMVDDRGVFQGVATMDLLLEKLVSYLKNNGNQDESVIGKYLIAPDDSLLISTAHEDIERLEKRDAEGYLYGKFDNPAVAARARELQFGTLTAKENGRTFLYCFVSFPVTRWIYLEKFDLLKLIESAKDKPVKQSANLRQDSLPEEEALLP